MGALDLFLIVVTRIVWAFMSIFFWLIWDWRKDSVSPIEDPILLQSGLTLAKKIRSRELTSLQVVEAYIKRLKETHPLINAVTRDRYEKAVEDAKKVDEILDSGDVPEKYSEKNMPYIGVPVSVKCVCSVPGFPYDGGLWTRRNIIAKETAPVVVNAIDAGAIPICMSNVSELCMWWESYNPVYGRSNNPYNTVRIVGGSSGGEGALLGAGASVIGIGSDIGGSIRMPSFFNGIFGHKPSRGVCDHSLQFPPCTGKEEDYLTTGPMVRYAEDLEPWFNLLARDTLSKIKISGNVDVKTLKFYYMPDDGGDPLVKPLHPDLKAAHEKVIVYIETKLKIPVKRVSIANLRKSVDIWMTLMTPELTGGKAFNVYLGDEQPPIGVYSEFAKWICQISNHSLPALVLALLERFGGKDPEFNQKMLDAAEQLKEEFEDMLGDDGVFLYPVHPTPAPYHYQPVTQPNNFGYTGIFNILGLPASSIPLGLGSDGVPLGIQVVGGLYRDYNCLAVARELEKAFGGWVPPQK